MKPPEQAVILCGGLGTRLRPFTDSHPKPMVPVNGKPFLEHLLKQLSGFGIKRFLLLTGYKGEQIRDYFGDGASWNWHIDYSQGPVEWETGRRFWEGQHQMNDRFLLLYSDNFVQCPFQRLGEIHQKENVTVTLLLAPKEKGNIRLSSQGQITAYDKTRTEPNLHFVEVGYMIVERDKVLKILSNISTSFDISFSEVLHSLAQQHQLAGLVVKDPYHSISDPHRLELMSAYLKPKNILLIDRDGVINQRPPQGEYTKNWEAFKWIPETRRALKELASSGFKFVVISNQAGIARGMIDSAAVEHIHENIISTLASEGIEILDIYFCPHHWDDHCECRKPNTGMFFRASREHFLRMDQTLYVGDDTRDCLAAYNAGCGCILVGPDHQEEVAPYANPVLRARNMLEAVPWIKNQFNDWRN